MRESRYRTSFSRTKFFLDWEDIFDLSSRNIFWAVEEQVVSERNADAGDLQRLTFGQVILDLELSIVG